MMVPHAAIALCSQQNGRKTCVFSQQIFFNMAEHLYRVYITGPGSFNARAESVEILFLRNVPSLKWHRLAGGLVRNHWGLRPSCRGINSNRRKLRAVLLRSLFRAHDKRASRTAKSLLNICTLPLSGAAKVTLFPREYSVVTLISHPDRTFFIKKLHQNAFACRYLQTGVETFYCTKSFSLYKCLQWNRE